MLTICRYKTKVKKKLFGFSFYLKHTFINTCSSRNTVRLLYTYGNNFKLLNSFVKTTLIPISLKLSFVRQLECLCLYK